MKQVNCDFCGAALDSEGVCTQEGCKTPHFSDHWVDFDKKQEETRPPNVPEIKLEP